LDWIQEKGGAWLTERGMPRMSMEELRQLEQGVVPPRLAPFLEATPPPPEARGWQVTTDAGVTPVRPPWDVMAGEGVTPARPPEEMLRPDWAEEYGANAEVLYSGAGVSSADVWVREFEKQMALYDDLFTVIGVGAGDQIKVGLETAAEDFGSVFLAKLAASLAPELVPYVMAQLAAQGATSGGQE
jgi:hypothetical protein